ncbi:hypothetical protein CEXT_650211 [Caerostris extrusa]|uniref:Uncharacterized protein n=1 Tax=Caerostris extrusa TaxID=172846 RepID=A0AAV4MZM9_CAEEX|nr:hypothetical protein CEXT_650211 [Caerostris extrusa]
MLNSPMAKIGSLVFSTPDFRFESWMFNFFKILAMYSSSDEESSSSGSGTPVYNLIGFKEIETFTGKRRMGIYAQKCSKSKREISKSDESSKVPRTIPIRKENETSERGPSSNFPLNEVGESLSIPKKSDKVPVKDSVTCDNSALANRSISIFCDVIDRIQKKGLITCDSSIRGKSHISSEERKLPHGYSKIRERCIKNFSNAIDKFCRNAVPSQDHLSSEQFDEIPLKKVGESSSIPKKSHKIPMKEDVNWDNSALANRSISIFCDLIDRIQKKGLITCESSIHGKSYISSEERKVSASNYPEIRERCIKKFSNAIDKFCRNAVTSQDNLSNEKFDEIPKRRKGSDCSHAKETSPECGDSTEELQQIMKNYSCFSNRAMKEDGKDGFEEIIELPCSLPDVCVDTKSTKLPNPERSYGTFNSGSSSIYESLLNLHDDGSKMENAKCIPTSETAENDDCCASRILITKSRLQNALRELDSSHYEDTEMLDKYSSFPAREMLSQLQVYFKNNPLEVENTSSQELKLKIINSRYFSDEFEETVVLPLCKYLDTDENLNKRVLVFSPNETLDDLPGYSSEWEEPQNETSGQTKLPEDVEEWLEDEAFYEEKEESTEDEDSQDEVLYETLKESAGEEMIPQMTLHSNLGETEDFWTRSEQDFVWSLYKIVFLKNIKHQIYCQKIMEDTAKARGS